MIAQEANLLTDIIIVVFRTLATSIRYAKKKCFPFVYIDELYSHTNSCHMYSYEAIINYTSASSWTTCSWCTLYHHTSCPCQRTNISSAARANNDKKLLSPFQHSINCRPIPYVVLIDIENINKKY